ncbi:hypothetical protein D3C81_2015340 [compost metagenome]
MLELRHFTLKSLSAPLWITYASSVSRTHSLPSVTAPACTSCPLMYRFISVNPGTPTVTKLKSCRTCHERSLALSKLEL